MEYKHVNGQAYCRYAATPPILNSPLADQYGIEVFSSTGVDEGRYVKLRVVLRSRLSWSACAICDPLTQCGLDLYVKDGKGVKVEGSKEQK